MPTVPTASQRRILERLASGAVLRLPPWSEHVQLVQAGWPGEQVRTPTYRALLRNGWIEREPDGLSAVPTFRLSERGRAALWMPSG